MNLITVNKGDEPVTIVLYYPREENNPSEIIIGLVDVRATNDIQISYDFVRDGWSIQSDFTNPSQVDGPHVHELSEVSFIPAWPIRSDIGG